LPLPLEGLLAGSFERVGLWFGLRAGVRAGDRCGVAAADALADVGEDDGAEATPKPNRPPAPADEEAEGFFSPVGLVKAPTPLAFGELSGLGDASELLLGLVPAGATAVAVGDGEGEGEEVGGRLLRGMPDEGARSLLGVAMPDGMGMREPPPLVGLVTDDDMAAARRL